MGRRQQCRFPCMPLPEIRVPFPAMTSFSYDLETPAGSGSRITLQDAREVVRRGRCLVGCFDRRGYEGHAKTDRALAEFLDGLYGAGFVMTDFDGPLFDRGPMELLRTPALAVQVVGASNVTTLRMVAHTWARGHHATYEFAGYPYFDQAHRTGALGAWVGRLDELCAIVVEGYLGD